MLEALRTLLADPDIVTDVTGAEPYDWDAGHQYLWPAEGSPVDRSIETGPSARIDFDIRYVYLVDAHESAGREREAVITAAIDARQEAVLAMVRENRSSAAWLHLQAAADTRPPATLTTRALGLRLTGYCIV